MKISKLKRKEFSSAMKILNNELGSERVRDEKFLLEKFKEFPEFFIGIFLDKELIGVICGFPREDYLLMSELAIDRRFQKRGFGKLLVKEFDKIAKEKNYSQIKVGAMDGAISFYNSLEDYNPLLLIQYDSGKYVPSEFNLPIIRTGNHGGRFCGSKD
jgi:GNAT superfamily N-acetyltransferase